MATTSSVEKPQENYTILRIKRKRTEEPLDALGAHGLLLSFSVADLLSQSSSHGARSLGVA